MLAFVETDLDIINFANLYNITVAVFEYGKPNEDPTWRWIYPNPQFVAWSNYAFNDGHIMYLYNEYNSHFDLLVERRDVLDKTIEPSLLDPKIVIDKNVEYSQEASTNQDTNLINSIEQQTLPSSPLHFQPHIKSRGRPKKGEMHRTSIQ